MSQPTRQRVLGWFASHPLVGLLGCVVSIVGLAFGVWAYWISKPSRELVLIEPSLRSIFVNAEAPPDFDVVVGGERIVKQDVFGVQFAVWNNGNQSIRPENVLEPLTLRLTGGNRIIDAQLLRTSRSVCGLSVSIAPDGSSARLDWAILEQGDGATVQLVIVGDLECRIGASGIIEGSGKPRYVRISQSSDRDEIASWSQAAPLGGWFYAVAFAIFMGTIGSGVLFVGLPQSWRERKWSLATVQLVIGLFCVLSMMSAVLASVLTVRHDYRVPDVLLRASGPEGTTTR